MNNLVSLKYNLIGGSSNMSLSEKIKFIENIKKCNGQKIKYLLDKTHMQTAYEELSTDPVNDLPEPVPGKDHQTILLNLYDQINFGQPETACYLDEKTREEDSQYKSVYSVRDHLDIFYNTAFGKGGRIQKILLKGIERFETMSNSGCLRDIQIIDWGLAGYHCDTRLNGEINKTLSYLIPPSSLSVDVSNFVKKLQNDLIIERKKIVETFFIASDVNTGLTQDTLYNSSELGHVRSYWMQLLSDQVGLPDYRPYNVDNPDACTTTDPNSNKLCNNCYKHAAPQWVGNKYLLGLEPSNCGELKNKAKKKFFAVYDLKYIIDHIYNNATQNGSLPVSSLQNYIINNNILFPSGVTPDYEELYEDDYSHFKRAAIIKALIHIGGYVKI